MNITDNEIIKIEKFQIYEIVFYFLLLFQFSFQMMKVEYDGAFLIMIYSRCNSLCVQLIIGLKYIENRH